MNARLMNADLLITGITQMATPRGAGAKRGSQMRELTVIENAAIAITDDRFAWWDLRESGRSSGTHG